MNTGTMVGVVGNGIPQRNVFSDPLSGSNAAINQFHQSLPAESWQRNELHWPGTFNIDLALHKSWHITESQAIKSSWQTFNLINSPRIDVGTMQLNGANNSRSLSLTARASGTSLQRFPTLV